MHYYLRLPFKQVFERDLHIGCAKYGYRFVFRSHDHIKTSSHEEWMEILRNKIFYIVNEESEKIDLNDFLNLIEEINYLEDPEIYFLGKKESCDFDCDFSICSMYKDKEGYLFCKKDFDCIRK